MKQNMTPDCLERLETIGVTLNPKSVPSVKFLGHLIGQDGVSTNPAKTSAIGDNEIPQSVSDLWWFLGMVNQLRKFFLNKLNHCEICTK